MVAYLRSACFQVFHSISAITCSCFTCKQLLCQYVNKDNQENISDAKILDCYYLKVDKEYLFYMTIKATEQSKRGKYEISARCNFDDGAITLDSFAGLFPDMSGMWLFGVSHALSWLLLSYNNPKSFLYSLLCCYKHAISQFLIDCSFFCFIKT